MKEGEMLDNWGWVASSRAPRSAYFHIPFCRHRCGYCNFSLIANRDELFDRFIECLVQEIQWLQHEWPMDTLFLGGGTPSILPPLHFERLAAAIEKWLPIDSASEVSLEANPLDITHENCKTWTGLGFNRISIGGQSFNESKLRCLERDHSPDQLRQSIEVAKSHFDNVSLDLIFAAPGETLEDWISDLDSAVEADLHHLSTYGLTFEKGSQFWGRLQRNTIRAVDESIEYAMYEAAIDRLSSAGKTHYEVSNFANPGFECRHNKTYWQGDPWWAFGPSAARFVGNVRSVNHRGTLAYLRRVESNVSPCIERELLSPSQMIRERFVFGMRQLKGVNWKELSQQADTATRDSIQLAIHQHVDRDWMAMEGDQVRLTRRGLMISDSLWSDYL